MRQSINLLDGDGVFHFVWSAFVFCVGGVFISVPRILGYRPLASLIADNKFHVTLEKYPLVDLAA